MKKPLPPLACLMLLTAMFTSCEKFTLDDSEENKTAEGNVCIKMNALEACSRASYAIFDVDEKIANINQTSQDKDFGTARFNLPQGTYRLVVIAHNGTGNCTISGPETVKFHNNKMSDTYFKYQMIEVGDYEIQKNVELERAVSTILLHITDENLPEEGRKIKFYYTGGSSTLDTTTGYGSVNSRQTESLSIADNQLDYTIYTFPHSGESDESIDLTISLLNSEGKTIQEHTLQDIKIKKNATSKVNFSFEDGSYDEQITDAPDNKEDWNDEFENGNDLPSSGYDVDF